MRKQKHNNNNKNNDCFWDYFANFRVCISKLNKNYQSNNMYQFIPNNDVLQKKICSSTSAPNPRDKIKMVIKEEQKSDEDASDESQKNTKVSSF